MLSWLEVLWKLPIAAISSRIVDVVAGNMVFSTVDRIARVRRGWGEPVLVPRIWGSIKLRSTQRSAGKSWALLLLNPVWK